LRRSGSVSAPQSTHLRTAHPLSRAHAQAPSSDPLPYSGANREDGLNNPNNRRLHELLLTIAEQMGVTDLTDFADPAYVQGPLSEVLV